MLDLLDAQPSRLLYLPESLRQPLVAHLQRGRLAGVQAYGLLGTQAVHPLGAPVPGLHHQVLVRGDKGVVGVLLQVDVAGGSLPVEPTLCDVTEVDGQALLRRVDRHVEPRAFGRVGLLVGHLLTLSQGLMVAVVARRAHRLGELLPDALAQEVLACQPLDPF